MKKDFTKKYIEELVKSFSGFDADVKNTLAILNDCKKLKVIEDYAICGSYGVMHYTEAFATKDFDICISLKYSGIIDLSGVFAEFRKKGYAAFEGQSLIVGSQRVDFVMGDELHNEALENAVELIFDDVPYKVFTAEYLFCIALQVYRASDVLKLSRLADEADLNEDKIKEIVKKYHLGKRLRDWRARFRNAKSAR